MWSFTFRSVAILLLLTAGSVSLAQSQESDAAFSERTRVTAVDVVIEVNNPNKIGPEDLTVRDGGQERPVVSVAPTSDSEVEPWRIVVYFDLPMATSGTVQAAISALAEQAVALVGLGTVEVIVASPTPRQLLPPTREPELINQSLSRLLLRLRETDELNGLRRAALAVMDSGAPSSSTDVGLDPATAVRSEIDLILRQQDEVLLWVADNDQVGGPRALFLVGDGFDLDPGAFYTERVPGPNDGARAQQLLSRANADLAKSLSGYGWIVYPLAFRDLVPDPEGRVSDFDRHRYRTMDGIDGETTALIPFNLKKSQRKSKARGSADTEFLLREPTIPLQILADATGGRLVDKSTTLGPELDSLRKRVLVTFQATGSLDGRLRSLTVEAGKRPLRSPTWVRSGTPAPVAESRIRRLMGGGLQAGELDLAAQWQEGDLLRSEVDLPPDHDPLTANSEAIMRITLGQAAADGIATFSHLVVSDHDYAAGRWSYDANLQAAPSTDWIVILVENLIDGSWGAEALEPPSR